MNARQCKKQLKKQIEKLNNKNDLMRRVIDNDPGLREVYSLYSRPLQITASTLQWKQFKSKRYLPPEGNYVLSELFKRELEKELLDGIKGFISYEFDTEFTFPIITASIFVGIRR